MTFGNPSLADYADEQDEPLKGRNILIFTFLMAIIVLPEELSFYLGTLRLTLARATLIVITPAVLFMVNKLRSDPEFRFTVSDLLFAMSGLWMLIAGVVMQSWDKGLVSSAVLVLEFCMTYLAARVLMRRNIDVEAAVRIICIVTSVVALFAMLDPLFGYQVVHVVLSHLTGYVRPVREADLRMGLLRAAGPIEHPILLGTMCALALILSVSITSRVRWLVRGCCLAGLALSFSSGAIGGLLVGLCFFAYNRIFGSIRGRWLLLAIFAALGVGFVFLASKDPLSFILSHLTFDPQSAYFRLLIWQYGTAALMNSPVFGIGIDAEWMREDWMPKSVDSFYLMSALNFGIPGSFLLAMSWFSPVLFPAARAAEDDSLDPISADHLRSALNAALVAVMYVGCTVHFWGVTWMLISVLAGLRTSLGSAVEAPAAEPVLTEREAFP